KKVQQMLTTEAKIAHRIGLTPNAISVIGFFLAIASGAAFALSVFQMSWLFLVGTTFLLASGFCDALDGIVARTFEQTTVFGGFFDSVLDRYADVIVFSGVIIASLSIPDLNYFWALIIGLAALSGSVLVSYTRARAEAAGLKMESVGLAERAERMLILAVVGIVAYFYEPVLLYGVALIAILANLTVIQRMVYVYKKLEKEKKAQ
ncbi:MAG: CDP-alcohol phosphatidyltransferase family protein, partial [Betaproteobacteria bacterium]